MIACTVRYCAANSPGCRELEKRVSCEPAFGQGEQICFSCQLGDFDAALERAYSF